MDRDTGKQDSFFIPRMYMIIPHACIMQAKGIGGVGSGLQQFKLKSSTPDSLCRSTYRTRGHNYVRIPLPV